MKFRYFFSYFSVHRFLFQFIHSFRSFLSKVIFSGFFQYFSSVIFFQNIHKLLIYRKREYKVKIQQKKKWAFHWENSVSHSLYLSSGFFLIGPFFDILFHFGYSMFWTFFFSLVSYTERYIYRKRNENHIDYECFYF